MDEPAHRGLRPARSHGLTSPKRSPTLKATATQPDSLANPDKPQEQ
jgi:hypothetical protein